MGRVVAVGAALASAALAAGTTAAARPADGVPPGAIATVAGEPIPRSAFDSLMERARIGLERQGGRFPSPGTVEYRQLKDNAVAFLVERVEWRQQAARLGIVVTDAQVDARIAEIVRVEFGGDEARLRDALARNGLTLEDLRDEVAAQLIQEGIFAAVTASATVSEAEIAAYYRSHRAQYREPQTRDVAHILVRTRARAEWLYAQIKAGASFATLARRCSLDPGSRNRGGRLTIGRGQTVRAFDRVAFSLRVGQVSQPVRTQYGWHVIKALSRIRPAKQHPLAKVRDAIRTQLLQKKRNDLMRSWIEALRVEYEGKVLYAPGFEPGG